MPTPLDSAIFKPLFTDNEITALLSDDAFVRALVEVEVALALAEARVGVIPAEAAEQIAKCTAKQVDFAALAASTARSGFPIIALVQELRRQPALMLRLSFTGAQPRRTSWTQPACCSSAPRQEC
jgi:3-carboxy-cis,cis-muconate cycloisomerase